MADTTRFVWYELMTADMEAAGAFYAKVMGWGTREASTPGMAYTVFTSGGASVSGLMKLPEEARRMGATPSWMGYVGTKDVDGTASRITSLGGTVLVPPQEIPSVSRFSVLADAQTAPLGLLHWLMPDLGQAADMTALGRVGWYELLATDPKEALIFYREAFGWHEEGAVEIAPDEECHFFSDRGETIGGVLTKPSAVLAPFWLYYFNVGDIEEAAIRVTTGGGEILSIPQKGPRGAWALHCMDPEGVMFGLVGTRSQVGSKHEVSSEVRWSSEWRGLSSRGRLLITN
jgi:uncharacterized protein